MIHELKVWPGPFAAVEDGSKTHEVRRTDRPFSQGDSLLLREWDPVRREYTGKSLVALVTYLTPPGTFGLPNDLCVMTIRRAAALKMAA